MIIQCREIWDFVFFSYLLPSSPSFLPDRHIPASPPLEFINMYSDTYIIKQGYWGASTPDIYLSPSALAHPVGNTYTLTLMQSTGTEVGRSSSPLACYYRMIGRQAGRQRQRQRRGVKVKWGGRRKGWRGQVSQAIKAKKDWCIYSTDIIHTCILVHTYIHMYNEQINKYIWEEMIGDDRTNIYCTLYVHTR